MDEALRRLVAFVAGTVVEGHQAEGIFDFATGSRFPVSGMVEGDTVDVVDETDGVRLSGVLPALATDRGESVTLDVADDEFKGRDHTRDTAFHGRVAGRNIDFEDAATGESYTYCL